MVQIGMRVCPVRNGVPRKDQAPSFGIQERLVATVLCMRSGSRRQCACVRRRSLERFNAGRNSAGMG